MCREKVIAAFHGTGFVLVSSFIIRYVLGIKGIIECEPGVIVMYFLGAFYVAELAYRFQEYVYGKMTK